jgi:hypothetical protein
MLVDLDTALAWHAWVGPNRLLTVDGLTRVDVWEMPARRPVLTIPGFPKVSRFGGGHLDIHEASRGGRLDFTLSPDGKRIALPRGGAITLLDTANGQRIGGTPAHIGGAIRAVEGIAFSPDGAKLAYTFLVADPGFGGTSHHRMRVIDGSAGTLHSECRLADSDGAIGWWGTELVVGVEIGAKKANVYDPKTGQVVARLATDGQFRLDGRDGHLWAFFGRAERPERAAGANYVCAYALPQRVKAGGGSAFRVTPDGIE